MDHILAHQYQAARRRLKYVKTLRSLTADNKNLDVVEHQIHKEMKFFENMIHDKSLLHKKLKIKKHRVEDVLAKNFFRQSMKNVFAYTNLTYRIVACYWDNYRLMWRHR